MSDTVDTPGDPNVATMTFWEHLQELRVRLIKMILAFMIGAGAAWWQKEWLLGWLIAPFKEAWEKGKLAGKPELVFLSPAEAFIAYIKVAVLGGLVLALPIIFYQLWAFVAPGLYNREKHFALPFVFASCVLFAVGALFGLNIAFPVAFQYLLEFGSATLKPTVSIANYIQFITRMLLAFGVIFELPVLVFFLSVAKVINHRHMIRFARYFIVVAFILGAILTPPDPLSQILMAGPLILLYGISIGIAYLFGDRSLGAPTE